MVTSSKDLLSSNGTNLENIPGYTHNPSIL